MSSLTRASQIFKLSVLFNLCFLFPKTSHGSNIEEKLTKILASGQSVHLVVWADWQSTVSADEFRESGFDKSELASNIADRTASAYEEIFLKAYGDESNFSVIDRSFIQKILEEQHLSMAISNDEALELGKLKGATHFLRISVRGTFEGVDGIQTSVDYYTVRLLSVSTGKILSVDTLKQIKRKNAPVETVPL